MWEGVGLMSVRGGFGGMKGRGKHVFCCFSVFDGLKASFALFATAVMAQKGGITGRRFGSLTI